MIIHTSRLVRAAGLTGVLVEAVDLVVGRRAGGVSGSASLLAGVARTANSLLGLVSWLIGATRDAEKLARRHLDGLDLVGLETSGRDVGGKGEGRQSGGDGLDVHCD